MNPSMSVIVPSLGRFERLRACLSSIVAQDVPFAFEIIVAIDGADSSELSVRLGQEFAGLQCLKFSTSIERRGSPRAKNDGAALAEGEILVFVDDDVVVSKRWLRLIHDSYSDSIVGVGGSEVKGHGPGFVRRAWFLINGNKTGRVTPGGQVVSNFTSSKRDVEQVDCLAGANMSFRKSVFDAIGGFDVNYVGTSYREETDLCLRVGCHGRLIFRPDAVVEHNEDSRGGNSPSSKRDWNYWYHRNNKYFYMKNLSRGSAVQDLRHLLVEVSLSFGRAVTQRSLAPISTMRRGMREGAAVLVQKKGIK